MDSSNKTLRLNDEQKIKTKQLEMKILEELGAIKKLLTREARVPMTIREAARYLNYTLSGIYRLTSRRKIPFYKNAKRIYFERKELTDWMLANKMEVQENLDEKEKELIMHGRKKRNAG